MAIVMASNSLDARGLRDAVQRTSKRRLSWAFAVSLAVHMLAIAFFAGMLESGILSPASRLGVPLPIDVALVAQRPIAFSAPPEMPEQASELPPTEPIPEEKSKDATPSAGAVQVPSPVDATKRPPVTATPSPGAALPLDPGINPRPSDSPPPANVTVGPVTDPDRLGRVQALRLASRFPQQVARRPRLIDTLTVPYPLPAAFAHRGARITVLMMVDASGRVTETTVYPDDPYFTPTVLEALRGARFSAATEIDGTPKPYWAMMEFIFTMRESARAPQPAPE